MAAPLHALPQKREKIKLERKDARKYELEQKNIQIFRPGLRNGHPYAGDGLWR
jgi:hypothetical protein